MDNTANTTNPPSGTEIPLSGNQPAGSQIPVSQTPGKSNKLPVIISLILFAVVLGAGGYYLGSKGYRFTKETAETIPTVIPSPELPTLTPVEPTVSSSESGKLTPTISPNSYLFISKSLGISFLLAKTVNSPPQKVLTKESGNKVFVYISGTKPESGQSVEVFEKLPGDTLGQAINKKFLSGISGNDCFVKIQIDKKLPSNFTKATISFPVPTGTDQPPFTFGSKCPENYRESNGLAYFLSDSGHPDKFIYLSIGQYSIDSETGKNTSWQDTLKFI